MTRSSDANAPSSSSSLEDEKSMSCDASQPVSPTSISISSESLRQAALRDHAVLSTPPEDRFDRIVQLAAAYFRAPIALVSLIDEDRQWFKSCVGLTVTETPRELAFCDHAIRLGPHATFIVEDASSDTRFCENPLVLGAPFIRFYAGVVLTTTDGYNLGTLCVIDTVKRPALSEVDLQYLRFLANMVVDQLSYSKARSILEEQSQLLKSAESMSGVGHWRFDPIAKLIKWSDEVFRIHGLPVNDAAPSFETIQQFYHEDDRETFTQLVNRAIETGEGYEFQLRIRRSDGGVRHTIAKAECALDHKGRTTSIFGVFQDVTAQHLAAASLAASERHYRLLADNVSDVVLRTDQGGSVTYVSPSCVDMSGYSPEELVGRHCGEFIHPDDAAGVHAAHVALIKDERNTIIVEYRLQHKTGNWTWLESHMKRWNDPGDECGGVISAIRDISGRKKLETELVVARNNAESATLVKARFLANMSHEIRTPMNGVLGFTELLLMADLPSEQRRYVELIADSGRSMMQLLNDILDVSKIGSGKMDIVSEPLNLSDILHCCTDLLTPIAQAKGVSISTVIDPAVPAHLFGDSLRLRQILLNLIGNAAKFTSVGSIAVVATADGGFLQLDVADTGIGIAAGQLKAIFDEFSQADDSTARLYGGTGLGLTISSELVRLMGGFISVSSLLGKGTTFTVRLPLIVAEIDAESSQSKVDDPQSSGSLLEPRVLIAEDHDINQELVMALARQAGVNPTLARDGAEAIILADEAARVGRPFALVLMDMRMPNIDGLEATRRLRASGHSASALPVVALTANAYAEDIQACLTAGMQAHLAKPIRIQDLTSVIQRFICRDAPASVSKSLTDPKLLQRFITRKHDMARKLNELASLEEPSEEKFAEAVDLLHKLAGVAAMFGDAGLGQRAKQLEDELRACPPSARAARARAAVKRFREAA
jgi:PAS domain S-box-containing protein